jgi:biliverdin reductase
MQGKSEQEGLAREREDVEMRRETRLGVVGSGGMAKSRAAAFSQIEGCTLTAVAARNRETGAALAAEFDVELANDWREIVSRNDIDALVVCTNNDSHSAIATAALEAGKHVFLEYPLGRHLGEAERLVAVAGVSGCVLRVAHDEVRSARHRSLKQTIAVSGELQLALFSRLTTGRGGRPDNLLNLNVSGPPALFFIYQIFPLVDLFGAAIWVEGYADYTGLQDDGRYNSFVNTMTVGFASGGIGKWTWAGGISIQVAEEHQRIVLSGGTLIRDSGHWLMSTPDGVESIEATTSGEEGDSMEAMFLNELATSGSGGDWREGVAMSLHALRISLGAEQAFAAGGRISL